MYRTRRPRLVVHSQAVETELLSIDGDGRAVQVALEALRAKRRERTAVEPPPDSTDALSVLRARHQADQTALRTRLYGRLSKASAYSRHADAAIALRDETIAALHTELLRLRTQAEELTAAADAVVADPSHAAVAVVTLAERARWLCASLAVSLDTASARRARRVDVSWCGMAQEVVLMGSFDCWSVGVPLSPDILGAFSTFSASLNLLPGSYAVKFLVDGVFMVAPDWPIVGEGLAANNELIVGGDDHCEPAVDG